MATSRQIGWDQESNLIYQIVKQLERLNQIIPNNQPALAPMMKRQIGWSQQSNLYYEWLRETDILTQHFANCCNTTTTTTTTTSLGCDCRPGQFDPFEFGWNYFDCTGFNQICTSEDCRVPVQPCFDINQPYSGIEIDTEAGWTCECSTTTTTTTSPA